MDKNKVAFWGVIILAAGVTAYFVIKNNKKTKTKAEWISNILKRAIDSPTQNDYQKLLGFQDAYLQAWSDAIDAAAGTFTFGGKIYDTATGDAKR